VGQSGEVITNLRAILRARTEETVVASEHRARAFLASWMLGRKATPPEVERERWEPEFLAAIGAEFDRVHDEALETAARIVWLRFLANREAGAVT
jgi:hypothetical protein